jgi:bacterioferritin-associated ferredoxin
LLQLQTSIGVAGGCAEEQQGLRDVLDKSREQQNNKTAADQNMLP